MQRPSRLCWSPRTWTRTRPPLCWRRLSRGAPAWSALAPGGGLASSRRPERLAAMALGTGGLAAAAQPALEGEGASEIRTEYQAKCIQDLVESNLSMPARLAAGGVGAYAEVDAVAGQALLGDIAVSTSSSSSRATAGAGRKVASTPAKGAPASRRGAWMLVAVAACRVKEFLALDVEPESCSQSSTSAMA
ncbi:unnamed protein product [Prorocentrum cordatum]|uniref:Pectinesterase inhibitor domain-containing protein n=1 Tax=Prorocentrum cordatum TaxID=2364126 RepID=A0ABN9VY12_9DINO|nr:unnamed protein product [Polarella glacialis]